VRISFGVSSSFGIDFSIANITLVVGRIWCRRERSSCDTEKFAFFGIVAIIAARARGGRKDAVSE
jgi:hypothetical protein